MTYSQLLKHYGSRKEILKRLNVSRQTLWVWEREGIPWDRQCEIFWDSAGFLKPGKKK